MFKKILRTKKKKKKIRTESWTKGGSCSTERRFEIIYLKITCLELYLVISVFSLYMYIWESAMLAFIVDQLGQKRKSQKKKRIGLNYWVAAWMEPVLRLLNNWSLDLNSLIKCSKSCLQDHVGSFRARMELRQTRRVPPSCKRTCTFKESRAIIRK